VSDFFAHHLKLDEIRDGQRLVLNADDDECEAIARRLGLLALDRLSAHASFSWSTDSVRATGRLAAAVTQACVVTGDPVESHLDEPFELLFMAAPECAGPDEEIELAEADCDVVFHDGSEIDLGGAIADTLGLALDPYPRSAEAEAALKQAGVLSEEQASPFAALDALKSRLAGDKP
jgi:uncharacterized metal-binding protein YceD (DUF177 family)